MGIRTFLKRRRKRQVHWYQPHWSFAPGLWSQAREILNVGSLARIYLLSTVVALVLWYVVGMPALPAKIILLGLLSAVLTPFVGSLQIAIHLLIPPQVWIRADSIVMLKETSVTEFKSSDVVASMLIVHSKNRIRLRITYTWGLNQRTLVLGVSPKVNLRELCEILPVPPIVRDARNRGASGLAIG